MNLDWFQIAMIYETLFIVTLLYSMRETIKEKIYGVRYKRWLEIDTGRFGSTVLDKSLDSCDIMGQKKSVSRANIQHGWMFFVNDNAENLKIENDYKKYTAYCNSEEFDTVNKNTVLKSLVLIMESKTILLILILAGLAVAGEIYLIYLGQQDRAVLDWVAWKVNQTNAAGNIVRIP